MTRFNRYIYYWNLQFLNNVIIIKADIFLIYLSNISILSVICWRLFQKRVIRTKFDIYVFIEVHIVNKLMKQIQAKILSLLI
jgi:hypothetical protein